VSPVQCVFLHGAPRSATAWIDSTALLASARSETLRAVKLACDMAGCSREEVEDVMFNTGAELFGERQRTFNTAHPRPVRTIAFHSLLASTASVLTEPVADALQLEYIKPSRQPNL
jgi:hypothetical protein